MQLRASNLQLKAPELRIITYPWNQTHLTRNEHHVAGFNGLRIRPNSAWGLISTDAFSICRDQRHCENERASTKQR